MRKPTRITKKQKDIIQIIERELYFLKRTNDLDSPTHWSDVKNAFNAYEINERIEHNITSALRIILENIKRIENE